MNELLSKTIVELKNEFSSNNKGGSHIQEIIPTAPSEKLPIDKNDLNMLHNFAKNNSIYSSTYELEVLDIPCIVYEGDMSNYWLDSIKHDTSYAPFYPVWILSAYALALYTKKLGINEVVDIIRSLGIEDTVRKQALRYANCATNALNKYSGIHKSDLISLLDFVVKRSV